MNKIHIALLLCQSHILHWLFPLLLININLAAKILRFLCKGGWREKTTLFSMDSNEITLHCAIYYKLGREFNKCKQFLPLSLNSFCSWHNALTQHCLAEVSGHLESAIFCSLSWLTVVVVSSGLRICQFLSEASICHFLTQYLSTFCLFICSSSSGAADVTR